MKRSCPAAAPASRRPRVRRLRAEDGLLHAAFVTFPERRQRVQTRIRWMPPPIIARTRLKVRLEAPGADVVGVAVLTADDGTLPTDLAMLGHQNLECVPVISPLTVTRKILSSRTIKYNWPFTARSSGARWRRRLEAPRRRLHHPLEQIEEGARLRRRCSSCGARLALFAEGRRRRHAQRRAARSRASARAAFRAVARRPAGAEAARCS